MEAQHLLPRWVVLGRRAATLVGNVSPARVKVSGDGNTEDRMEDGEGRCGGAGEQLAHESARPHGCEVTSLAVRVGGQRRAGTMSRGRERCSTVQG